MNNSRIVALTLCLGAALALIGGCTQEEDPVAPGSAVTTGIVADLAAAALGGGASTQGLAAQMEGAASFSGGGGLPKAADLPPFDTTVVRDKSTGLVTYHYVFTYSISVTNLGNRVDLSSTMRGTLETPRLSSTDSAAAAIAVTHVIDADTHYTVDGTYFRSGLYRSKAGSQVEFSSLSNATITAVKISKATNRIQGGSATMTVAGNVSGGGSFTYTIQVDFIGNDQAILTIDGALFVANLAAGTASPIEE